MDSLTKLEGILESFDDGGRRLRRLYARRPDLFVRLRANEKKLYTPKEEDLEGSGFYSLFEWEGEVAQLGEE